MEIKEIEVLATKLWERNQNFSPENGDKVIVNLIDDKIYGSYISPSKRGSGYYVIGEDGSYLFGASSLSPEKILEEYKNGRRSN